MSKIIELSLTCPRCGNEFQASGHTLVDAADEADAEVFYTLQQGSINLAHCPNCDANGLLPIPIVLHQPDRQLLIAFVPGAESMNEEQVGSIIGPMLESFINSVPEDKQQDYLYEPIVTDDPMALVMAARGESLDDNYEVEGDYEGEDGDELDEELTPEEMAEVQARQELLQRLMTFNGQMDSLNRIGLLRENKEIVDDMLVQLIGIVTEQAQNIQPDAVPLLNKIMNEVEVFISSN